jgi:hypothetical protein
MARVLNVKTDGVTRGVYDKDLTLAQELVEVTFEDDLGVPHTVFSNKNGPFKDADAIIKAWGEHTLHDKAEEQPAPIAPASPAGQAFE